MNEYIERDSFRWSQASHGICKDCKERVVKEHKESKTEKASDYNIPF
jgi:hypothetical protein